MANLVDLEEIVLSWARLIFDTTKSKAEAKIKKKYLSVSLWLQSDFLDYVIVEGPLFLPYSLKIIPQLKGKIEKLLQAFVCYGTLVRVKGKKDILPGFFVFEIAAT